MTYHIIICLALFVLMMGMLAWNRYPMGVIGLAALTLLVLAGILSPKAALTNFGNANVVIIMGMFIVGAGLKKTSLIGHLTTSIRKVTGGNFQMAYRSVILLAVFLTSILTSPAVCYAIVFPIMDSICEKFHVSKSKVQFPLCLTCITCAGVLPFGFAISEAAVFNGLMETYGYQMNFTALDFTMGRFPIMVLAVIWALFFAQKKHHFRTSRRNHFKSSREKQECRVVPGTEYLGSHHLCFDHRIFDFWGKIETHGLGRGIDWQPAVYFH